MFMNIKNENGIYLFKIYEKSVDFFKKKDYVF